MRREGDKGEVNQPIVHSWGKRHRTEPDEGSHSLMPGTEAISLPDRLVGKVLSMIPFPEILKTRQLNKSWNRNFSASPSWNLHFLTSPPSLFRYQVKAMSARWSHYCPIFFNLENYGLVGYDPGNNRWLDIPVGFKAAPFVGYVYQLRGAGSLIAGLFKCWNGFVTDVFVFVTNIVTRTWKWLPSRPVMENPSEFHLSPIGSNAYLVLLITKRWTTPPGVFCQIYDSRMGLWTIMQFAESILLPRFAACSSAYLNGVLYVMDNDHAGFHDRLTMVSCNVSIDERSWTNIDLPICALQHDIIMFKLLVCQNHVMVVIKLRGNMNFPQLGTLSNSIVVCKLDPVSLDIEVLAKGPPKLLLTSSLDFVSDNNECIYFGNPQYPCSSVGKLNLQNGEWSCLLPPKRVDGPFNKLWTGLSIEPGLNPFVSV